MKVKPPLAYGDIAPVYETALARSEPITYKLAGWGKVLNWVQRFYRYRKQQLAAYRERVGEVPGIIPRHPAENLYLSIRGLDGKAYCAAKPPPREMRAEPFLIHIRQRKMEGELLDAEGNPITPEIAEPPAPQTGEGLDLE